MRSPIRSRSNSAKALTIVRKSRAMSLPDTSSAPRSDRAVRERSQYHHHWFTQRRPERLRRLRSCRQAGMLRICYSMSTRPSHRASLSFGMATSPQRSLSIAGNHLHVCLHLRLNLRENELLFINYSQEREQLCG
jgi:hypothetical protein